MITVKIMGRLGNQMFQIAAAESLAIDNKTVAAYPVSVIGACPTHEERALYSSTILSKIKYMATFDWLQNVWKEESLRYKKIEFQPNILLDGYFQSEKYFAHNAEAIRKLFQPDQWTKSLLRHYYGNFLKDKDNLIAVHVRRGDYVKLSDVHNNLGDNTDYYKQAMQKFNNGKFVFFSDDIEWCQEKFGPDHLYVKPLNDVLDLYLMSAIPNKIIANSSFSWWAAWLGEVDGCKIVAPKNWFANELPCEDIIPERWERV